ncbi:MAG: Hpt domain-containing protein [Pyrinomonadaceae bacterium]
MDQTQRQFLADTEDVIEQILANLDELRRPAIQGNARRDLLDEIFRSVHRVKGSAGSFGLPGLSEIAHEFEGLLSAVRAGQTPLNESVLQTCDLAAVAMLESLQVASTGDVELTHLALIERLRTFSPAPGRAPDLDLETTLKRVPPEIWQSLSGEEKQRLAQAIAKESTLYIVATNFDTTQFDDQFNQLKAKLSQHGEVVASSPLVDPNYLEKINFRILFAGESGHQDLTADLANCPGVVVSEVARLEHVSPGADPGLVTDQFRATSRPSLSNFVRLDTDELDRLISSTNELFRTTIFASLDLCIGVGGLLQCQIFSERYHAQKFRTVSLKSRKIHLRQFG